MKNKDIIYKILISIVFGLAGFIINFFPVHFWFPPHKASFMIGLVSPMIITLAWGWKYGLLSALAGGCQTLWFLWLPTGGYGAFVSVPMYTFWIVWHGWSNEYYKRNPSWQLSPYIMEIGFRIFNTIVLYTIWRWVFTLNPPPWSPELPTRMAPLDFTNFCVIKEAVNGYIVLLISNVLLNIGVVRRILRLRKRSAQIKTTFIISASVLFGCLIWIIDGIIDFFVFTHGSKSILDSIILDVPNHTLFMKTLFIIACLTGGLLVSRFFRRQFESEEKYRLLADNTIDCIWQIDLDFKFIYVNPSVLQMLGFTPEEWIGSSLSEHCSPEDIEYIIGLGIEELNKSAESTDVTFETVLFHKNGGKISVEISAKILFDDDRNLLGFQGTTRDITERRKAEKKLIQKNEQLELVMKGANIGWWDWDISSGKEIYNEILPKLLGYKFSEIEPNIKWWEEKIHPDDLKQVNIDLREHLDGKTESYINIHQLKTKTGKWKWFLDYGKVVSRDKNGKPIRMIGTLRDIDNQQRAEDQIKASLKEKEILLKEIHHRVKNNMQVISSLLALQSGKISDEQFKELFNESRNRIHIMALAHEKIYQSGDMASIDFSDYTLDLIQHLFQSYGVDPSLIKYSIDVRDIFLGIDNAIPCAQIISELISNSLKHAFPEGRSGEINVDFQKDKEGRYTLTVSDNGSGLPEEFDFKKPKSLGLQLVDALTRQLKGDIELDRSGGTKFVILF